MKCLNKALRIKVITAFILAFIILATSDAAGLSAITYEYLSLWQSGDYSAMYDMLSDQSKTYISRGEFIDQQRDFARKYIINDFQILEVISHGQTAIVHYRLELTRIGGSIEIQDKRIHLSKEKAKWKIDYWNSSDL